MKRLHFLAILVLGTVFTACFTNPTPPPSPVAPTITITTPITGQNFTTPSATIAGTVSGSVTALSYTDNANTPRYPLTPAGNFSFNVGLNPGANTIRVYAQNGNSAEVSSAITINYTTPKFTLTTNRTGQGTITSNLPGISCGTTCTFDYAIGTSVTLTATPDSGSSFASWNGACSGTNNTCTITMNQTQNVTAVFSTNPPPADTIPPTIFISSPANNSTVTTDTVNMNGTANDNVGVAQIQYSLNGATRVSVTVSNNWSFTTPTLKCDANTLVVYAKDATNSETPSSIWTINRDCGKFSLNPASSNIVIAQNADALYYLDLSKTAPFNTPANALSSITATGSIVGTGTNQVRVFYRPDLSSATQAAIVIQAGSSVPLGAQTLVLNAVGGGVNAAPLTLNFTTVVCSSGC